MCDTKYSSSSALRQILSDMLNLFSCSELKRLSGALSCENMPERRHRQKHEAAACFHRRREEVLLETPGAARVLHLLEAFNWNQPAAQTRTDPICKVWAELWFKMDSHHKQNQRLCSEVSMLSS